MSTWTSAAGLELTDRVPAVLRREWVHSGLCPGRDLHTLFREQARAHPRREAVIDADGALDYESLGVEVRRLAAELVSAGIGNRDVVGIQLGNGRAAVAAELAVYAAGAVALPCPAGGSAVSGLPELLCRARASAVINDRVHRLPFPAGGARRLPVDPEAPARILVSSGSEAEPKLVAYSHNAFAGGRASYLRALRRGKVPMRNLVLVPLASSFGSCGVPVTIAALGGTLLLTGAFDAAAALRMLGERRATHVFGVPTMLGRMAALGPVPGEDFGTLQAVVSSGAALPERVARACQDRFRTEVITVYGSSDGVNCHTAATGPGAWTGRPDPAVASIRIVDERGRAVRHGQPGEICARGPMTPLCYVDAPGLDARYRLPGGWVRTGDRGLLDSRGRLHVLGRIKQIVIRGGYNISPAEIEAQLGTHPAVAEVACVGVPDDDLGERLCACVAPRPAGAGITLAELTWFLEHERGVERRKLPEALVLLAELPLGPTGKVCRRTLTSIATARRQDSLTQRTTTS
ncbi:class I adenylate-forming enzyme family protein [Amycolatopsis nigrescens]|uniref:class I adenylate-forming enzyme family protein n=1 Tax=Amycolatopsis nigrescens TaxID=381445 RepID=UPI000369B550|nr:class I adenylate-forming enzyme family protein [Amycolatopsis nigrescens]